MITLSDSPAWFAAGWTMVHFLWIGALVGVIATALRAALVRVTPQIRYAIALTIFAATAVVPAILFVSAFNSAFDQRVARAESTTTGPLLPIASGAETDSTVSDGASEDVARLRRDSSHDTESPAARIIASLSHWLPWFWICGTPAVLVLLALGVIGAERLRRDARPLEVGEFVDLCRRWQGVLDVGQDVALAISERVAAPLLVGILKPTILLPASVVSGCTSEQLEMILIHELAHVRRWDNLINLAQRLIEAALFFHPVIWRLSSWIRLEREQCCDSIVLAHTSSPQMYAETLVALAMPGTSFCPAAVSMTGSPLEIRLLHILNLEEETMSLSRKSLLIGAAIVMVGAGLAVGWSAIQEQAAMKLAERARQIEKLNTSPAVQQEQRGDRTSLASSPIANSPYRVASPDVLSIEVNTRIVRVSLRPGDEIVIRATNTLPIDPQGDPIINEFKLIKGPYQIQPDGTVDLGPEYGSVAVEGKSLPEARAAIIEHLQSAAVGLVDPKVSVSMPFVAAKQVITGEHTILPDGTIWLGEYGSVALNGLTLDEVKTALEQHLKDYLQKPEIRLGVVTFH